MWNKLKDYEYFMKFCIGNYYEILITDFVSIWSLCTIKDTFITYIKESNKRLQISENDLLENIQDMLRDPADAKTQLTLESTPIVMQVFMAKESQNGYPVKLKVNLTKSSENAFFHKVTLPLMSIVKELQDSQKALCDLLMQKDREIECYKIEGATLTLKYLKTPVFNRSEHLSKYVEYAKLFGSNEVPNVILKKKMEQHNSEVKEEPIKEELSGESKDAISQVQSQMSVPLTFFPVKTEFVTNTSPNKLKRKLQF